MFFIFVMLNSLFSLHLYANEPTRQQVVEFVVIDAPVDKVWAIVGDFSGLHKWHPAIKSTEMQSNGKRILSLAPDKKITEWLIKRDDESMTLSYKIIDMSILETFEYEGLQIKRKVLPVDNYTGIMSVTADGEGSKVTWKGNFYRAYVFDLPTPEGMSDKDASSAISSVYQVGLNNLKAILEGKNIVEASPSVAGIIAKYSKAGFDPDNPYQQHIKCDEGKPCRIDKFLLHGMRTFGLCQRCHGMDGNGSTIAPSLLEKLKTDMTYELFIDRVANGFQGRIGVMPPWIDNPNIMKKIDNLYAYLKARSDNVIPTGRLKKFKH